MRHTFWYILNASRSTCFSIPQDGAFGEALVSGLTSTNEWRNCRAASAHLIDSVIRLAGCHWNDAVKCLNKLRANALPASPLSVFYFCCLSSLNDNLFLKPEMTGSQVLLVPFPSEQTQWLQNELRIALMMADAVFIISHLCITSLYAVPLHISRITDRLWWK